MKLKITALLTAGALMLGMSSYVGAAEVELAGALAPSSPSYSDSADFSRTGGYASTASEASDYLPRRYSSVDRGYVLPARQQRYNTCWAYSSSAVLESFTAALSLYDSYISAMHINYWGTADENGKGWNRQYYDAGYPYIALGYLTSFGALRDETFPTEFTYEQYGEQKDSLYPFVSANKIMYIDSSDPDNIKDAVYNYGAVTGNFHYSGTFSNGNDTSYYCDTEHLETYQLSGHSVTIIGWDDDYSKENFVAGHQPASNGAWLCKNSWGPYSGENGFIWISYEDHFLFDKRFGPSFAILGADRMTAVNTIKQNEIYGATYEFDYINGENTNRLTFANVFDFSDKYRHIDKVVFESTSVGSPYSVYYIPLDENNVPVKDESKWSLLAQGTINYEGYHSVNAYGFTPPVGKGAVGIQINKFEDGKIAVGTAEWLSSGQRMIFEPDTKYGDSYIIGFRSAPMDLKDFYHKYMNAAGSDDPDEIGGTFVIKALCYSDDVEGDVDRDGDFTIADVTLSQRYHADMVTLTDEQLRFADFDNDCSAAIVDCTAMQRKLAE